MKKHTIVTYSPLARPEMRWVYEMGAVGVLNGRCLT
jgi:hypothetical protein